MAGATLSGSPTAGLDVAMGLTLGALELDVSLRVGANEVVALLGPNGAGKTTLLRALAGLEPLGRGRVVLDGEVLEDAGRVRMPPERRPIGVVFQEYLLFPHLTALDNVAFGLRSRGVPRAAARERAAEWLARLGLSDRGTARPHQLSGGQAQRVALARALAVEPRLLLLDEPLAALDASTRVEIRRELAATLASFAGVRLLVTHEPLEAMALADRLIVLEEGRIVQSGPPAELGARPRSRYVADLVGVNLFRGRGVGNQVELPGGECLVVAEEAGGDVFAMVHPRAVSLHRQVPEGTPRNVWPGEVGGLDLEGDRVRVRVRGRIPIVSEVTAAAVGDLDLAVGRPVWVSVKAAEVNVYPA
ncbi:MAG TPA: ABC transporter ATP-binding protein [Acidimicrobiales bacterium]|jgi:molybdate transport system ATP-binding protein|nr:ABC transporter ATP-binding protein [Acidimicrobiales bacterium]